MNQVSCEVLLAAMAVMALKDLGSVSERSANTFLSR